MFGGLTHRIHVSEKKTVKGLMHLAKTALESGDPLTFSTAVDELMNFGVYPDFGGNVLAKEIYERGLAEQIDIISRYLPSNGKDPFEPRYPLRRREHGPESRDGLKRALQDYYESNDMPPPKDFHRLNKAGLSRLYYGIINQQEESRTNGKNSV